MISDTIAAAVVMTIILFKPFQHNDNIILLGTQTTVASGIGVRCLGVGGGDLMGYKVLNK